MTWRGGSLGNKQEAENGKTQESEGKYERKKEEWEVLGCTKLEVSWTFLWGVDKGSQWRKWKQVVKEWWWVLSYEGALHVSCCGHEKVGFVFSATMKILWWKQMKPMWKLGVIVELKSKANYESWVLELEFNIYPWCYGKNSSGIALNIQK